MNTHTKGNTLIEVILVIAIMVLILAVVVPGLSAFRQKQILKNTTEEVKVLLNEARVNTLASKNSTFYSVHFESTKATLFTGGTYSAVASDNKVITFDPKVTIVGSNILLNGSGVNVSFDRLTGNVSAYGTIRLELVSSPSINKTITISQLGVVSTN